MSRPRLRWLWLVWLPACGAGAFDHKSQRGNDRVGGEVLSTVDGQRITRSEVSRLAERGELTPRTALDKLQAERLLEREAERRGYAEREQTRVTAEQAMVQALLARDVESVPVSEAEIAAAYAHDSKRFTHPEQREATHVLAYLPPSASPAQEQAAHGFADMAVRKLLASSDLKTTLTELSKQSSAQVAVRVEGLPPIAQDGSFVPEFEHALFSSPKTGVVPEPVRTKFGWHVIVVTAITPPSVVPLTAARDTLAQELALAKRKQRLAALLAALQARTKVEYEQKTERALASLEL
jgi:peptidyl-prolyl cis-trans isomerase C